MNRICKTCNIEVDEKNYLKDRTVCKSCKNKKRRKKKNQQPKIDKINNNKTINQMFRHMKITPMLLLAQETLVKPFICPKC